MNEQLQEHWKTVESNLVRYAHMCSPSAWKMAALELDNYFNQLDRLLPANLRPKV